MNVDRLKQSPLFLITKAKRRYYGSDMTLPLKIEIMIDGEFNPLILEDNCFYRGQTKNNIHYYGELGRYYFEHLMPKFGVIHIKLADGSSQIFNSFEAFLCSLVE